MSTVVEDVTAVYREKLNELVELKAFLPPPNSISKSQTAAYRSPTLGQAMSPCLYTQWEELSGYEVVSWTDIRTNNSESGSKLATENHGQSFLII